jgi:hypothetical protein
LTSVVLTETFDPAADQQRLIAINELLGFRVASVRRSCELDLTAPGS